MNASTTLSKIMGLLGIEKNVNLSGDAYGKLENGDIVATDFFQLGAVLFSIDESGAKKRLKDGEYKLFTPGNQTDGPTAFMMFVEDSMIKTLDEIREDADAKKQPTLSKSNGLSPNTNLSQSQNINLESMDNKMKMEEVENLNEPLSPVEKDAMRAEIEDIKKSLASLQEALASLVKEKEASMASQADEGMNDEEKARKKLEGEEMYAYGKNNEAKQAKSLQEKGSQNQNLSAIKNQLFKGAPIETSTPNANVKLNNQSVETSMDRVFKRLSQA